MSRSERFLILDDARAMGIHLMGTKGTGKSRLLGRSIAWLDFLRGVPQLVLDPHGEVIKNFLDKFTRLSAPKQRQLVKRVRYIDLAGNYGRVTPLPLYYRADKESLYAVSQRYLDAVQRLDPGLRNAPIQGWNSVWRIGTNVGMVLAATGLQITEAEEVLKSPGNFTGEIATAARQFPEIQPAVDFLFQEFPALGKTEMARRSEAYLTKIGIFKYDPVMKATYGASTPGIHWQEVIDKKQTVLIDFQHEIDEERKRFKLLWTYLHFLEFIKRRGSGKDNPPISLVIDEITYLLPNGNERNDLLTADLNELTERIARNYCVWITLAHQDMYQLSVPVQRMLLALGTQIIGRTADQEVALRLAKRFYRYDPEWIKRRESIPTRWSTNERITDYTVVEQNEINSQTFLDLERFTFLAGTVANEGSTADRLRPFYIGHVDEGEYVNKGVVEEAMRRLSQREGRTVEEILEEIETRRGSKTEKVEQSKPKEVFRMERVQRL